jgi:uncharacterized protein (DUF2252 family)
MSVTEERSHEESRLLGKALRRQVPRSSHAEWTPTANRPDPIDQLKAQNVDRLQWLVPVRFARMSPSAFTFYRGAAKIMAGDLATTPDTGLSVQVCGDAHLLNFGAFGSPERALVFDLNDFDETLPGPWEWDVKRFAASLMIASRDNEYDEEECRTATRRGVQAYREAMGGFAGLRAIDVWYSRLTAGEIRKLMPKKHRKTVDKRIAKARSKDSLHAFSKLAERDGEGYRIQSDPPLLHPHRDLGDHTDLDEFEVLVGSAFDSYKSTLRDDRRLLLDRYRLVDWAIKVVGVGSAGTRCFIVLLMGRREDDPLFLQVKEASASVLEDHLPASAYDTHGRRVVEGQRLMQAASDVFLGWTKGQLGHYYWRQLRDMKGGAVVDTYSPRVMAAYARLCGHTLARAHARSGDPVAIASYLGTGSVFDEAITTFAERYADQNQDDHRLLREAIKSGRVEAADED